ncbi:hypothetical protein [Methanocella arvoryzae]|uniref:hypothetical protein n=1 Tax=Methanocella arvoryzae TaxID=1175445 RepID=UPI000323DF36|nr:hypothetical protein [Methanocella arvoryzae]
MAKAKDIPLAGHKTAYKVNTDSHTDMDSYTDRQDTLQDTWKSRKAGHTWQDN